MAGSLGLTRQSRLPSHGANEDGVYLEAEMLPNA